jgi:hypothetical protein
MSKLKKIKPAIYLLPQEGMMRVPGLVVAMETLLHEGDIGKPHYQVNSGVKNLPPA